MTKKVTELLLQSLEAFEDVLIKKDVVKVIKSFPELTNALNDQQDLTKRLILEPSLPSVVGSELWRNLVSAAYIESSELSYQIRKMTVLRQVLEVGGVPCLVSNSQEYESFLTAIRDLALAVIEDGRCAAWIEKHLWLLLLDATKLRIPLKTDVGIQETASVSTDEQNRLCNVQNAKDNTEQNKVSSRAQVLNDLALQYVSEGHYEVAVPLCNQALDEMRKTKGSDHPEVAKMLTVLALIYRDQRNYKKSAQLLNDALIIRRAIGENNLDVASSLNNLGVLHSIWGKFKDAESFFKRALVIREKVLGSEHPSVANQLSNLSFLCRNLGRYKDGVAYCERALEIYNRFLSPENSEIAKKAFTCLNNGKYKEAGSLYQEFLVLAHENSTYFDESRSVTEEVQKNEYPNSSTEQDFSRKVAKVDRATVSKTLRNLSSLLYCQHKYEATKTIETCLLKSKGSISPSPKIR